MFFKPLEYANPPKADDPDPSILPLFASLGHAVARWAFLEYTLSRWLSILSGMPHQMANDIFLSPQSFKGRLDVMRAALQNSSLSDEEKRFVSAVLDKASQYSTFRNSIVHGFPFSTYKPDGTAIGSAIIDLYGSLDRNLEVAVTLEHVDQAAMNFNALISLMQEAHIKKTGRSARNADAPTRTLQELQKQVELLPNIASSHELSQNQRGRLRQQQAAVRKPIPKRNNGKGS